MARLSRRGQERGVRQLRQVATWLARNADHSARVKLRTGPPGSRLSRMPTESPGSPATSTQLPLEKLKELLTQRAFICTPHRRMLPWPDRGADAWTPMPVQAPTIANEFDLPRHRSYQIEN